MGKELNVKKISGIDLYRAIDELHSWSAGSPLSIGLVSEWSTRFKISPSVLKVALEREFFRRYLKNASIHFEADGKWDTRA